MKPCEIAIRAVMNELLMKANGGGQVLHDFSFFFFKIYYKSLYKYIQQFIASQIEKGSENFLLYS